MPLTAIKVLAVDDEPGLCILTKQFLEISKGIEVDVAFSAEEAVRSLSKKRYDAIVSDYQMPNEDGIALLKRLRLNNNKIPFILFTGRGREEVVIEALNSGADFYLQKGGDPRAQFHELEHKIREAVLRRRAEETVTASNLKLNAAMDLARIGYWTIDLKIMVLTLDERIWNILGTDGQTEHGNELSFDRYCEEFVHPDDREKVKGIQILVRKPSSTLDHGQNNFRIIRKDGEIRHVQVNYRVVRDPNSHPIIGVGAIQDITENKQAEEALRKSESQYRSILNASPDCVAITDLDGNVIQVSPKTVEILRYTGEDEFVGRSIMDFLVPDARERAKANIGMMFQGIFNGPEEYQVFRSDGSVLEVEVNADLIQGAHGNPNGLIFVIRDITDRKQNELRLHQNNEELQSVNQQMAAAEEEMRQQLDEIIHGHDELVREIAFSESLMESLPGIFYLYDAKTLRLMRWNRNHQEVSGYSREEMSGKHVLEWHRPENAEAVLAAINNIMNQGRDSIEASLVMKDGHEIPYLLTGERFDTKERSYFMGFGIDITERKRAEEALHASQGRYKTLFSAYNEGVALHEMIYDEGSKAIDYRILEVNPAFEKIVNIPKDRVIGRPATEVYGTEAAPYLDMYSRVAQTGESTSFETFFPPLNKHFSITVFSPAKGQFATVFMDVTERRSMEHTLLNSESQLRTLVQTIPDMIWLKNMEGVYLSCNPMFERFFGAREKEIQGRTDFDFVDEEMAKFFLKNDQNAMAAGKPTTNEEWVTMRDGGQRVLLETIKTPMHDSSGTLIGILGIGRDITKRKRAEEALKEGEEKHRLLIENSHDIIYTITKDGTFTFVSPSWTTILGHPVDQVVGRPFQSFVHADDLAGCMAFLQRAIETGQRQTGVEYRVMHSDGAWRWHTSNAVTLMDNSGIAMGIEGIASDITVQKMAEDAVHQISDRLQLATKAGGVGIWDYDVVRNELKWDDQMYGLYGITKHQFSGVYEAWRAGLLPEDEERGDREIQMAFSGEKEFDTEFRVRWPDGSIHSIRALALVQRDSTGRPLRMVGTNWDITAGKKMEGALRQANAKLGILNSITRHDMLNQIALLKGFLELGRQQGNDPVLIQYFDTMTRATDNLQKQIAFTKDYQDMGVKAPSWISVSRQTADAFAMLHPAGVTLEVATGGLEIMVDQLATKVPYNLIDNSIRHGEHVAHIKMSAEHRGDALLIVYEDDGVGISDVVREHLFEKGFGKNNGLGMFLVREILTITGITVEEKGQAGQGVRFEMLVPAGAWRHYSVE